MNTPCSHQLSFVLRALSLAQTGCILAVGSLPTRAAVNVHLEFSPPSIFNESNRQAVLEWPGEPGKQYLIQCADDLSTNRDWKTVDIAIGSSTGPIRWMAPEALRTQKYYRLVLPQPEVHSVEPAFVDASDPAALLYLTGQCLPTDGSVVINGQNFTPTSADPNGRWIAVSLNGLPPGTPVVGTILVLDSGSNVVTTLPVQSPVIYGTEMAAEQLQGPPSEPPASPQALMAAWLSKKGYDYYKVKSDMATAGLNTNPYFVENGHAGEMPLARGRSDGHVTVLKSHEGGDGPEIIAATGELQCDETDLVHPGRGLDFAWTRSYRSRTGPTTAQGAGWDFSYNVSLTLQPDGTALLRSGNGRADTFHADGTNGWVRDEYFVTIGDLDGDGSPERVTFSDTGKWLFHPPGTAAAGKLSQIVDRNNNTITLNYDVAGRLDHIVDDLGRTNTVAYNATGQIASVTDFSGRTVSYEYDPNGDLTACISPAVTGTPNGNDFPGGKTNRYAYSSGFADTRLNHNLMSCTDAKGQTWLQVTYHATNNPSSADFDAVSSLLRGIEKEQIKRGMVTGKAGSPPRLRAIINDGVGNVCEAYYDSRQRLVELQEYTGRANPALPTTETENRPTGKLRVDDPDLYVTQFEWNADSLCTKIISPRGNITEMVYQRAYHQNEARSNRRHAGNLRVLREVACCDQDDDGDGLTDSLTKTFEYDPRFGSPAVSYGKKIYVGNLPFSASGRSSGNVESAKVITDRDTGRSKGFGFVTLSTDPRGIVTTAEYDTHGNCTKSIKQGHYAVSNFHIEVDGQYNSHGQLTAITNAADGTGYRRVDTLSYYSSGPQAGYVQSIAIDEPGVHLTTSYEYDARGNVTRCVDARGNDWLYDYNQLDQCVRRQTPHSSFGTLVRNATSFLYDANNNLVRVDEDNRDADGNPGTNAVWRTQFVYDSLDRMTACWRDKNGNLVLRCNEVQYDANDNVTLYRSGEAVNGNNTHAVVQFLYDERNLPYRCVAAPGSPDQSTAQCDYDANGLVTRLSEGLENTPAITTFEYDGFAGSANEFRVEQRTDYEQGAAKWTPVSPNPQGPITYRVKVWQLMAGQNLTSSMRVSKITDPMGNVTTCTYDRNGNLVRALVHAEPNDGPGSAGNLRYHEWRWNYDSLDRCVRSVDSFFDIFTELSIGDGESTGVSTYAPNGQLLTSTDDNGRTTTYSYDTVGRLASVRDAKNNVTSYTYDACGNVLSVTQTDRSDLGGAPQQFSLVHAYDSLHRLIRTVDNVGNTNLYAYDSRDNLVRTTDPRGNDTCYFYDGLNRCTDSISYVGPCDASPAGITINTTHVEYSDNNRVTASTDSNTNTTLYAYDALDRCVQVTAADGTRSSLVWSPRSNLVRQEDANGTVITNVYDLLDRCVARLITPGPAATSSTTFETFAYDGLSRCVAATNDVSSVTFAFDSLGNCVRQTQDGWTTTSTHDGVGNRLSMTYPGGRVVSYTYDALNQPTSLSSSAGAGVPPTVLAQNTYDGPGRLARMTRTNNVNTRFAWNGLVSPPNAAGDFGWMQVRGVNHQVAGGGAVVDQRIARFDRSQNRTLRAQVSPFVQGGTTLTNTMDYDALDRLRLAIKTKGTSAQRVDYTLDGNGNRLSVAVDLVAEPYLMDNTFPDPADFQMNQYTLTPSGMFQYDANGNRVAKGTAVGQLQYQYDYADRLVAVTDLASGLPELVSAYAYDALGRRISKTVFAGGLPPVTTQFVHGGPDDDCDGIIEERDNGTLKRTYAFPHVFDQKGRILFTDLGETLYCHDDDLGNALALTDATGAVVERYEYDDYGAVSFLTRDGFPNGTGTSSKDYLYCWGGLRVDLETGLHNDGAGEYYDPQLGRPAKGIIIKKPTSPSSGNIAGRFGNNPWRGGGQKAQDHNSSRSNKSGLAGPDMGGGGGGAAAYAKRMKVAHLTVSGTPGGHGGSKAQDHNSSRSNKSGLASQGGGGGNRLINPIAMDKGLRFRNLDVSGPGSGIGIYSTRAQDHNSSRSNKSGLASPWGGGDPSELKVKIVVKM